MNLTRQDREQYREGHPGPYPGGTARDALERPAVRGTTGRRRPVPGSLEDRDDAGRAPAPARTRSKSKGTSTSRVHMAAPPFGLSIVTTQSPVRSISELMVVRARIAVDPRNLAADDHDR